MKYVPVVGVYSQGRIVIDTDYVFGLSPHDMPNHFNAYLLTVSGIVVTTFTKFPLAENLKTDFLCIDSGCVGSIFSTLEKYVHVGDVAIWWDVGAIYVRVTGRSIVQHTEGQNTVYSPGPPARTTPSLSSDLYSEYGNGCVFGGGVVSS